MIKYYLRRPLFPTLFLILMVFEVLFMGVLKRGIERDMQAVENMYDTAKITYEAFPTSAGDLTLRPHFTDEIERMDEVEEAFSSMRCPYTLREPAQELGIGWMYGTNNVPWFEDNRDIYVQWLEEYAPGESAEVKDWENNDDEIPCIVDDELLKKYNLTLGDHFTAAPYDLRGEDSVKAPGYNMYIVGHFSNSEETVEKMSIIVPECIFLQAPSAMYNATMQENYLMFKQYQIRIKSEYSRDADEVEDKMIEIFHRAQVLVHSDVRVLRKAVRPIEQRLKIQKALERPMETALSVSVALIAVLMAISIQDDVFLYILNGESRIKTFLKTLLCMIAIICGASLIAGTVSIIVLGREWAAWTASYIETDALLCVAASALPILFFCNKNLVNFYQTKEA